MPHPEFVALREALIDLRETVLRVLRDDLRSFKVMILRLRREYSMWRLRRTIRRTARSFERLGVAAEELGEVLRREVDGDDL